MGVTSHPLYHMLPVRSQSQVSSVLKERRLHKDVELIHISLGYVDCNRFVN